MIKKNQDQICQEAIEKIEENLTNFKKFLHTGTRNLSKFISLNEIEEKWENLSKSTNRA